MKVKSRWLTAAAAIMMLLLVMAAFGCEQEAEEERVEEGEPTDEEVEEEEKEEKEESVVLEDFKEREIEITEEPHRIVSLSPSTTEITFALGLDDRLVGVTEYCNYPSEAQEKTQVGGFADPNVEKIVEQEPDLVLADDIHEEVVSKLDEMDLNVLVLSPGTFEEIFEAVEMAAQATGTQEKFRELEEDWRSRLDAVASKVEEIPEEERVQVYYEVYSDPLMSAGEGSIVHEIITTAGGVNIFSEVEERYPQVSGEKILEQQPEVILFPDYHGSVEMLEEMREDRPGWDNLPAVINERVHDVNDDMFSRHGPRIIDAVEKAAEIFYPEKFE